MDGGGEGGARGKRSFNFIEYPRASSTDLISPLEYIEESWLRKFFPGEKVHPFREKLSVAKVTKVETFVTKSAKFHYVFPLWKRSTPERYDFDFLKGETRDVSGYTI